MIFYYKEEPSLVPQLSIYLYQSGLVDVSFMLWIKFQYYHCLFSSFPFGSVGKESACKAGDLGSIPGLGRSPGEEKGYPFQYPGLENSMEWPVHGVPESDMTEQLSLSYSFSCTKCFSLDHKKCLQVGSCVLLTPHCVSLSFFLFSGTRLTIFLV